MEKILIKGDVYTVATKTECKVTSANGTPLGTATAEAPYTFPATTDRVVLSDPDAEFARVNPKYAPVKLRLLGLLGGGVSALPKGYLAAEFLESTGTQYVVLPDLTFTKSDVFKWRIAKDTPPSLLENVAAYWSSNSTDLRFFIVHNTGGLTVVYFKKAIIPKKYNAVGNYELNKNGLILDGQAYSVAEVESLSYSRLYLFCQYYNGKPSYFTKVAFSAFEVLGKCNLIPSIDNNGTPCMYDKLTKTPFYNSGSGQFVVGMNMKQAQKLSTLPAGVGTLTVSLPWDAQFADTSVPDALQTAADKGWTITVQYREEGSERISRYAACTTVADMQAVNADFKKDLTADGAWVYPLPTLKNASWAFNTFEKCKAWLVDLPSLENGEFMLVRYAGTVFDRQLPKLNNGESMFRNMTGNKVFRSALPELTNGKNMFCAIAIYGLLYLSFESALPKLSTGLGMFNLCVLDKQSVFNICNSIPVWASGTHELTLGIHIDLQADDEVLSAIADAEAKGWAMTVQWNGTATAQAASTFGLRKPPIYAKLGTLERPDGTTEQVLDWGHYVTEWEANGYQEFASVEEAEEHFNIKENV